MQESVENGPKVSRVWVVLGVLGVIVLLVVILLANAPRGFDMDLTNIGNGKPALVFVYDPNLSVSAIQTAEMNKIRDEKKERIQFLVADIGRPEAQRLMAQNQVGPATLLIFSGNGQLLKVERSLVEADALARMINTTLPRP